MSDWSKTLPGFLDRCWAEMTRGVASAQAPMRYVVLATTGLQGGPEARLVALRGADPTAGTAQVHTDIGSVKVAELRVDPRAALHLWDPEAQLQIRLRGTMTIASGAEVAETWARVPPTSRLSYGVTPAPGTPIPASDAYDRTPNQAQFAVMTLHIDEIDAVHLAPDYHRRALYTRADAWTGTWRAP